jgi:hypothetical protein
VERYTKEVKISLIFFINIAISFFGLLEELPILFLFSLLFELRFGIILFFKFLNSFVEILLKYSEELFVVGSIPYGIRSEVVYLVF